MTTQNASATTHSTLGAPSATTSASATASATAIGSHPDILPLVLSHLPNSALYACLQVSKSFFFHATPILYHTITISPRSASPLEASPFVGCTRASSSFDLNAQVPQEISPLSKNALLSHIRVVNVYKHAVSACPFVQRYIPPLTSVRILHLAGPRIGVDDDNIDREHDDRDAFAYELNHSFEPELLCSPATCQFIHKACTPARQLVLRDLRDLNAITANKRSGFVDVESITLKIRWCQIPIDEPQRFAIPLIFAFAPSNMPSSTQFQPAWQEQLERSLSLPSSVRTLRLVFWDELHAFRFPRKASLNSRSFIEDNDTCYLRTIYTGGPGIGMGLGSGGYNPFPLPREGPNAPDCHRHDVATYCGRFLPPMPEAQLDAIFRALGRVLARASQGARTDEASRVNSKLNLIEVYNPHLALGREGEWEWEPDDESTLPFRQAMVEGWSNITARPITTRGDVTLPHEDTPAQSSSSSPDVKLPTITFLPLKAYYTAPFLAEGEIDPPEEEYYKSILNPSPNLQHLREKASHFINLRPPPSTLGTHSEDRFPRHCTPDDLRGWTELALRHLVDFDWEAEEARRESRVRADIRAMAEARESTYDVEDDSGFALL